MLNVPKFQKIHRKRIILMQQGISDLNDPLTMVKDDAIWLHGDIYLNKKHSLKLINK